MAAVDLTAGDDETAPRVHRLVPSTESPAGPVQLVDGLTMGRNQGSTVQIKGRSVEGTLKLSSKHIRFVLRAGSAFVVDSSTNGTTVNGMRINKGQEVFLTAGDEIGLAPDPSGLNPPEAAYTYTPLPGRAARPRAPPAAGTPAAPIINLMDSPQEEDALAAAQLAEHEAEMASDSWVSTHERNLANAYGAGLQPPHLQGAHAQQWEDLTGTSDHQRNNDSFQPSCPFCRVAPIGTGETFL
jgi:hypothetical protein